MNKQKNMQTIVETNSLKNIINESWQKINNTKTDTENISIEKFRTKKKLIEEAPDMTTHEKLDALDKNYEHRNQEHWQNVFLFEIIPLSVLAIGISIAAKMHRDF